MLDQGGSPMQVSNSLNGRSYNDSSLTYEETQIEADTFVENLLGLHKVTEGDEEEEEDDEPKPWARLVSVSPLVPIQDLFLEPQKNQDDNSNKNDDNRIGLYTLGRSKNCNFVFHQKCISNEHCLLYCLRDAKNTLCPYIEDSSANGTFINKSTRLKKGVRRLLHNGDMISLVNPESRKVLASARDVELASFFVQLYLPSGDNVKSNANGVLSRCLSNGQSAKELHNMRSATVMSLLGQERDIFDYYDKKDLIGSGGNGQVYRCIHKVDGHEVAVKATSLRQCMLPTGEVDHAAVDRLLMEAHMIRNLKHNNIIQLEDVFSDGSTLYLVMELVRGGDLFDRILERKGYSEDSAKQVIQQVLFAMQFMHDKKIAHRDMKPENILLVHRESDTKVKITDFGLAKSANQTGGLKTYCGTPYYFAPEVLEKQRSGESDKTYGFETDMWSIGVITYVMLTADYPWSSEERAMSREIATASVNFEKHDEVWQRVSPAAKDFISCLLVLQPEGRLTAAQALVHPWFDSLRGHQIPPEEVSVETTVLDDLEMMSPLRATANGGITAMTTSTDTTATVDATATATATTATATRKKRKTRHDAGPEEFVGRNTRSRCSSMVAMEVSDSLDPAARSRKAPKRRK